MILVGTKDPDEIVRKFSISHLPVDSELYARFILECLLNDSSDVVKRAAAIKVASELSSVQLKKSDLWCVFRSKHLFLDGK